MVHEMCRMLYIAIIKVKKLCPILYSFHVATFPQTDKFRILIIISSIVQTFTQFYQTVHLINIQACNDFLDEPSPSLISHLPCTLLSLSPHAIPPAHT